jgi:hypothetical protein
MICPAAEKKKTAAGQMAFCAQKHFLHGGSIRAAVFLCLGSFHGGIEGGCRHAAPDTIPA